MAYDFDENNLYQIDNMSLYEKKEQLELRKHSFESELENTYVTEINNGTTCMHDKKVNKLAQCNLILDILNLPKRTKN